MSEHQKKCLAIIAMIHADMANPGARPMTSRELEIQADRRRSYANTIKFNGGKVRPEYE
jgi:hypothetical protein